MTGSINVVANAPTSLAISEFSSKAFANPGNTVEILSATASADAGNLFVIYSNPPRINPAIKPLLMPNTDAIKPVLIPALIEFFIFSSSFPKSKSKVSLLNNSIKPSDTADPN